MNRIREWIVNLVCMQIVVGGNCGVCGSWVSDVLLPRNWPYTICENCIKAEECLCSVGDEPYHDDWCPAIKSSGKAL